MTEVQYKTARSTMAWDKARCNKKGEELDCEEQEG
jgi:hypothetical protein